MSIVVPKISVIVPVYNTEQYLDECIQSILNQSFTDFELLLIDDGSTDRSGSICDQYTAKDERVRVFHRENGGVIAARTVGIRMSKADWLYFIDADDKIESDTLTVMFQCIENEKIDMVIFGGKKDYQYSIIEYTIALLSFHFWSVCGKLYKRCLFDDYVMDISHYFKVGEDFLTNLRVLKNITGDIICKAQCKYLINTNNSNSVQTTHQKTYEYERSMILEVGNILKGLPWYSQIEYAHLKWLLVYLGGMIGLCYSIDFRESWVQEIKEKSRKFHLTYKEKMVILAVKNPLFRLPFVLEKAIKRVLKKTLLRF